MVNESYIEYVKDTSLPKMNLNQQELDACEDVAEEVHNEWARGKLQSGIYDHPDLDFYKSLSRETQMYDVSSARATLSILKHKGWTLVPPNHNVLIAKSNKK